MRKKGLLNQPLSAVIAGMGHTDMLVVADAGLPIPLTVNRIDLAVTKGVPAFVDVLRAILDEMVIESAIIAEEVMATSPQMYQTMQNLLGDIPLQAIAHEEFKRRTESAHAIVRTGEFTPFANIILIAGVAF